MSGGSDQTTSSNTNNYDQRQINTTTVNNNDLSNRSTQNYDFSNRSTNLSSTTTVWDSSTKVDNHAVTTIDNSSRVDSHNVTNNDLSNRSVTTNNVDNSNRSVTTTNIDNSNRSVSTTTTLWDSSSHDVTNVDNSDHSVTNTTNNYLDAGAVSGGLKVASDSVAAMLKTVAQSLGLASSVTAQQAAETANAYDYADNVFHASLDAVNQNDARMLDAFTRAATMENDALVMAQTSAKTALDQVQNAYADAKGTTQAQQKIMIAVLAVAGVAVLSTRMGK